MQKSLPYFAVGPVVKGFGRGSKELGIPTANFPEDVVEKLPEEVKTGVYYGWAKVDNSPTLKMVMSVGWNPYYDNEKKSMETHIIHEFEKDFYGSELKVMMLGFIRPEKNFNSLEALISAIKNDIAEADKQLSLPESLPFKEHSFFTGKPSVNGDTNADTKGICNGIVNGESKPLTNGDIKHDDS